MVMIAAMTSLFFSVFLAFLMEYVERASSESDNTERIETLKRYASFKEGK